MRWSAFENPNSLTVTFKEKSCLNEKKVPVEELCDHKESKKVQWILFIILFDKCTVTEAALSVSVLCRVENKGRLLRKSEPPNHHTMGAGLAQCQSIRLPLMWPGFDSQARHHKWAEFVGSLLCSKRFFSRYSGFPLSSKTNI